MVKPEMIEVDVWMIVNADGEYVVTGDSDELGEKWAESDFNVGLPSRTIQMKVRVPKPKATVVVAVLPDELSEEITAKVA